MNRETPHTSRQVRTTISVDAEVLEVFQRLSAVTGMSQSKAIGEWLADTVDAAATMADLMEKARQQPKMVAMELRGYALGLSDLTADLVNQVKAKGAAGSASRRSAARTAAPFAGAGDKSPPVGNTGGKLKKNAKN